MTRKRHVRLLPKPFDRAWLWPVVGVLPALILILLNRRALDLVRGELTRDGLQAYHCVLGWLCGLIIIELLAYVATRWLRHRLPFWIPAAVFGLNVAYLWGFCILSQHMIPSTVADWMLSAPQLLFQQFALISPILFYTLLAMVGRRCLRVKGVADAALSSAVLVCVPAGWLMISALSSATRWDLDFPTWLIVFLVFASSAIMVGAFLRVLLWLYSIAGRRLVVAILASLVLPIAGLVLNYTIPFPCDLQDWRVYALTVLNALVVCWPSRRDSVRPGLWFARVLTLPFTLYFFLVFLPFLPLAIPAILAVGSGFLILAPTMLFVIHSSVVYTESRVVAARWGRGRTVLAFIVALLVLPALYTGGALLHRGAINRAVAVIYEPDYSKPSVPIQRGLAKAALKRLRAVKAGRYLPFINEYYNGIVFGGMTLPDHKIDHMESILFDREKEEAKPRTRWGGDADFFSMFTGSTTRRQNWNRRPRLARAVTLSEWEVTHTESNGLITAAVTLTMSNPGANQDEFVGRIELPRGASITGYWLDVEGERVPGQIFEQKTAEWVYHMIRDSTRRDPGLLRFDGEHTLDLNVFPFAAKQERQCGLELVYPIGWQQDLKINDQALELPGGSHPAAGAVRFAAGGATSLLLPASALLELPHVKRKPYFHFLVDASDRAVADAGDYAALAGALAVKHPDVEDAMVDFVSFETTEGTAGIVLMKEALAELQRVPRARFGGGYWPERAARHAIARWATGNTFATRVPVFICITQRQDDDRPPVALGAFARYVPESPQVFDVDEAIALPSRSVVVFAADDHREVLAADEAGWLIMPADAPVSALDASGKPIPVTATALPPPQPQLAAATRGHVLGRQGKEAPVKADGLRRTILGLSRESGVLLPGTAYIVVENSAQWEMLKRSEKKALAQSGALEFDEFDSAKDKAVLSEPGSTVWLLLMILPALVMMHRRRALP